MVLNLSKTPCYYVFSEKQEETNQNFMDANYCMIGSEDLL